MALSLKAKADFRNNCTSLLVTDVTGEYDSSLNTGGWGAPNISVSDVSSASITITYPDGSTQTVDVTSQVPGTYSTDFNFNHIAPTTSFADGLYEITYSVTSSGGTAYTYSFYKPALCGVACCVDKKLSKLPKEMCTQCEYDEYLYNTRYMTTMLNSLSYAAYCAKTDQFADILETLQALCDFDGCNCS